MYLLHCLGPWTVYSIIIGISHHADPMLSLGIQIIGQCLIVSSKRLVSSPRDILDIWLNVYPAEH